MTKCVHTTEKVTTQTAARTVNMKYVKDVEDGRLKQCDHEDLIDAIACVAVQQRLGQLFRPGVCRSHPAASSPTFPWLQTCLSANHEVNLEGFPISSGVDADAPIFSFLFLLLRLMKFTPVPPAMTGLHRGLLARMPHRDPSFLARRKGDGTREGRSAGRTQGR